MPVAYSYVRFSTPEQAKGDSLRRQRELSENYALRNGLTLDTTLTFHDLGISAFKGSNVERGRLGAFLEACDTSLVAPGSYLLVESLDRLSRETVMDAFDLFRSILKKQINIVTLTDNRVYSSRTTEMTDLIISLTVMSRAHEESLTKSKRQRAAWSNKRANIGTKKLTARCPLWMKLNDARTEFEFIPDRVELVKEIIALAKNGCGQAIIAKMLNERGTPAFSGNVKGWWPSYIQKILTSKQLHGEFQPGITKDGRTIANGEPIEDYYPALITKEEFYSLQAFRSQNYVGGGRARKGSTVPNVLSGLLQCGYCNGPMTISGAAAKRIKTSVGDVMRPPKKVLVCDAARRGMGCYAVQWGFNDFETSFMSFARGIDLDSLLADLPKDSGLPAPIKLEDKVRAIDEELIDIQKKIERLLDLVMEGNTPASVNSRIAKLESEKNNAETTREKLLIEIQQRKDSGTDSQELARATKSLIEQMNNVGDEDRFRVRAALSAQLRRFIESVKLYPAGRLVSAEFIANMRTSLIEQDFSEDRIDKYLESFQTEPKRQGRGNRGRYASRKDIARLFTITTKNGGVRVVSPNFDDPTIAVVELGFGDDK
ncbi:recombinase family protein [Paraburkholderia sediminicola]|uniref:recombinase family protein n=1 Tax=Paraburkholderia sediminicola TaxID=458836 RepID=UPI0038BD282D